MMAFIGLVGIHFKFSESRALAQYNGASPEPVVLEYISVPAANINFIFAVGNENWEHQHGILVDNLDNPGWRTLVGLGETELQWCGIEELKIK